MLVSVLSRLPSEAIFGAPFTAEQKGVLPRLNGKREVGGTEEGGPHRSGVSDLTTRPLAMASGRLIIPGGLTSHPTGAPVDGGEGWRRALFR